MLELKDFTHIFEISPLAHMVMDIDENIVLVNEAFCQFMGHSKEKFTGMKYTEAGKKFVKYIKVIGESVSDAIKLKRDTFGEVTVETKSGLHVMSRFNHPMLDDKCEVKFVYITYNEITKTVKNSEYMRSEIDAFIKVYDLMAEGDLTKRHPVERPEDPDLVETFEFLMKLRTSVRGLIVSLQDNIKDVNTRMNSLVSNADIATKNVNEASGEIKIIAENIDMVSENSSVISQNTDQIVVAMQDLNATVEEITSNVDSVSVLSRETSNLSHKGSEVAGKAEKSMGEILNSTNKVYEIVTDVKTQMDAISKIVQIIRDLASQTNLLALNAAIEAARAGDAGRDFAVVASEVKTLAQESKVSAENIEEIINTLKGSTDNATVAMEETKKVVLQGSTLTSETLKSFNEIAGAVDKIAGNLSEIAAATEEQAATTEELTASIHEVSGVIQKTASEANEAANATVKSSNAMDEISNMIKSVNNIAVEALTANKKFKV